MAVPPFQDFMLPFLRATADQKEHSITEIFEHLAKELALSDEDIKELVPSRPKKREDCDRLRNRLITSTWAGLGCPFPRNANMDEG